MVTNKSKYVNPWKRLLDVMRNTPNSYKKSMYPISVNIVVLGIILIRCLSVGYFVMGLVWKLHTGVIDESWIGILNRLWVGNLRLGNTINGLVLMSVCLLPFYVISGSIGLLGMFCRKKIFVVMYMISLLFYILLDAIFLSIFTALRDGIDYSLSKDFQNIYSQIARFQLSYNYWYYTDDVKGSMQDWLDMFSKLGCCGITDQSVTFSYMYQCLAYSHKTCWGLFSTKMRSYLTTYGSLAGLCFVSEILQLGVCDFIYSQMSEEKFPFALPRTCISVLKISWKRNRHTVIANISRILTCIPAICLLALGSLLLVDNKLSGHEVNGVFVHVYILGLNFIDIIKGFGIAMIVLGSVDLILNSLALVSDLIHHSKTKNNIIAALNVILLLAKVTVFGIVIKLAVQVNNDLRFKMANLLRQINHLRRSWVVLFGELECCGVSSSYDVCNMFSGNTYCFPRTCCHTSLYNIYESQLYDRIDCNSPNTPCLDVLLSQFRMYTTGFFIGTSFSILLGVLGTVLTIFHTRTLIAEKADQTSEKVEKTHKRWFVSIVRYTRRDVPRTLLLITSVLLLFFSLGFFIEGFALMYDKVYNHEIIRTVLWSALTFDGLSFDHIRQTLASFMISSAVVITVVSGSGFFTLRTKSKCLYIFQTVLIGLVLTMMIVGTSLWGKSKDSISYRLDYEMAIFLQTHGYNDHISYLFATNANSAWSNLFAVAECCGIRTSSNGEFTTYFGSNQIPIYCCKENLLTEPYSESNTNCTNLNDLSLNHNKSCIDKVLTRLDEYSGGFIGLSVLTVVCFVIQVILIIYQLKKMDFDSFDNDKYVRMVSLLCKMKKGWRNVIHLEKKMILTILTMLSALSMLILGIVMKHDDKMTGDYVHNVYALLYFKGVNLRDIIETMYMLFIILGILSMVVSFLGLSDVFIALQAEWKTKFNTCCLLVLSVVKLVCVFLMIPIRMDIDENASYQLTNMDRQYRNYQGNIYSSLNRFYFEFDCCGADGTYEFEKLEGTDGYSGQSGAQPYVCCWGSQYLDYQGLASGVVCEKKACTPEFRSCMNGYSNAFIASLSITTIFEIVCLVIEARRIHKLLKSKTTDEQGSLRQIFIGSNGHRKKILGGIITAGISLFVAVGMISEGAALRYDAVFSHRQIDLVFSSMSAASRSMSTNLLIWKWSMFTCGILIVVGALFTMTTIQRHSKLLHLLALIIHIICIIGICSVAGWWIAVHSMAFTDNVVYFFLYNLQSTLINGYSFTLNDAWNVLFSTLECCGYNSASEFFNVRFQSGSYYNKPTIFCCHTNPITKTYNYDESCTTDTSRRYTESCSYKLSQRLLTFSIVFYVMLFICLCMEIVLIVLISILLKHDEPFHSDPIFLKCISAQRRKPNKGGTKVVDESNANKESKEMVTDDSNQSKEAKTKQTNVRKNKVEPLSTGHESQKSRIKDESSSSGFKKKDSSTVNNRPTKTGDKNAVIIKEPSEPSKETAGQSKSSSADPNDQVKVEFSNPNDQTNIDSKDSDKNSAIEKSVDDVEQSKETAIQLEPLSTDPARQTQNESLNSDPKLDDNFKTDVENITVDKKKENIVTMDDQTNESITNTEPLFTDYEDQMDVNSSKSDNQIEDNSINSGENIPGGQDDDTKSH